MPFPLFSQNTVYIGIDKNYPPHEFVENGEIKGFNVDIYNELARVLKLNIVFVPDSWQNIYTKLINNQIQIASLAYSEERAKYFDFTESSTLDLSLAIFVKDDVYGITEISDLKNYTVAVQKNDIAHIYLNEHHLDSILIPVENQEKAIELLENNSVFAFFGNKYTGLYFKYKFNYSDIKIIGNPIPIGPRKLAVKKGNIKLRDLLDSGFKKLREQGVYNQVYNKWVGYSYESYFKVKKVIDIVLIFLLILIVIIIIIILWNRLLKVNLRKKVKELELSENKYRSLVYNIKGGIICLDPANKIIIANPSALELLRIEEDNIIGQNIFKLKIFSSGYEKLSDFIKERRNITRNFRLIINNIEYIFKITGFVFINERNKQVYALLIDDITEAEMIKEQLLETQKMDALGRLINGITHSFNNILTGIMSSTDILLNSDKTNNDLRPDIQTIEKLAHKAKELTDKLATFNKIQFFNPEIINLNDLLVSSQETLKTLVNENIELSFYLSDTIKPVKIDINQFNQLIFNLMINAEEAMPSGGEIIIETKNISLDKEYCYKYLNVHEGEYVLFQFTDTGSGINEENQKHIFEPFFSTKKHVYSGLGLSMVYGIVKQNNGDIKSYSEKGHGTTFKIFFPVHEQPEQDTQVITDTLIGSQAQIKNKNLIIVEDDQDIKEIIEQYFKLQDNTVFAFKTGMEAVSHIEASARENKPGPDYALIDIVLPDISANEVYAAIRTKYPEVKAVFMSGYPENAMMHQGMINEKTSFIQKPFKLNDLIKVLNRFIKS